MEFITGVVRRGAEAGVATPCSEALLGSQLQIDTGEPAMEPSNLQPLHERIAAVASDG